ncbi:MAG: hypothetical protein AB7U75_14710 [Hyphomicrobiaceae bacterium]
MKKVAFVSLSAAKHILRTRMYETDLATPLDRIHLKFIDAFAAANEATDMEAAFLALSHGLLDFDKIIAKRADQASPYRAEMYRNVRRYLLRLVNEIGDLTHTDMLEMQKEALKTAHEGIRKAIA